MVAAPAQAVDKWVWRLKCARRLLPVDVHPPRVNLVDDASTSDCSFSASQCSQMQQEPRPPGQVGWAVLVHGQNYFEHFRSDGARRAADLRLGQGAEIQGKMEE